MRRHKKVTKKMRKASRYANWSKNFKITDKHELTPIMRKNMGMVAKKVTKKNYDRRTGG